MKLATQPCRLSLTSSQDYLIPSSIGVTNHPVYYVIPSPIGVVTNPTPASPLLGTLSLSIKHRQFNCPLARPSSGEPPTPPPKPYARKRGNKLLPICTYHGINTRYMKGYTARLSPPDSASLIDSHTWLRIPTNHSVGTASRGIALPLRTQLFEV